MSGMTAPGLGLTGRLTSIHKVHPCGVCGRHFKYLNYPLHVSGTVWAEAVKATAGGGQCFYRALAGRLGALASYVPVDGLPGSSAPYPPGATGLSFVRYRDEGGQNADMGGGGIAHCGASNRNCNRNFVQDHPEAKVKFPTRFWHASSGCFRVQLSGYMNSRYGESGYPWQDIGSGTDRISVIVSDETGLCFPLNAFTMTG